MTAPALAPAPDLPADVISALTAALPSMIATAIGQLTPAPVPAPTRPAPWTMTTASAATSTPEPDAARVASGDTPVDTAPDAAAEPDSGEHTTTAPEPTSAAIGAEPGGKSAPGALRAAVARLLAEHPDESFTVTQAAKLVGGKSGGAVGNALDRLTTSGHAARISDKPRTYTATPTTATAGAPTPTTPAAPAAPRPARPRPAKKTPAAPPAPEPSDPADSAPAPAPESVWDGKSPLPRPNGAHYHPRTLADTSDVAALRRLRAEGVPALLYGPPGTGKTSLVEAAFPDAITVCGDGDTQVSDLIGSYTQRPDGGYEFVYGPLVTAMQEGRVLFLDDATLIPPPVLAALYPGMDGRRQITVKEHKGETITAAAGFYVVAGHNPHVHGAILSDALSSRFSVQVEVSSDYDLARTLKIDATAVRVAKNLATRKAKGEIGWAPQLRELLAFHKIQTILGKDAAWSNLLGIAPPEDRDTVASALKAALGREITHLALGKQL